MPITTHNQYTRYLETLEQVEPILKDLTHHLEYLWDFRVRIESAKETCDYHGAYAKAAIQQLTVIYGYLLARRPVESTFDLDALVNRFLSWQLPRNFSPDCGIKFSPPSGDSWPIGTNLFTAEQASQMLEHVLDKQEPTK